MSEPVPVHIVSSAARAIVEASKWWAANRPKALGAFAEELDRALQLIASQPAIGARAQNTRLAGIRRIHLARVHYYLYYRVLDSPQAIEVLAFWHTSRGSRPPVEPTASS